MQVVVVGRFPCRSASLSMGRWRKELRGMARSVDSRTGISVLLSDTAKRNNDYNARKK